MKFLTSVCSLISGLCWAAEPQIEYSVDVAATDDRTVDVADRKLPAIWRIRDQIPAKFFRTSKKFHTPLNGVRCVAIDYQRHLVAGDSSPRDVYRFSEDEDGEPVFRTENSGPYLWKVSSDGATQKWLRGRPLDRPVGLCRFDDDLLITDHHRRTFFRLQIPKTVTVFAIGVFDSDETDE